ncbi:MAG TPA: hypothetical protein VF244_03490, partial [Acidimicrobiales bacterium]
RDRTAGATTLVSVRAAGDDAGNMNAFALAMDAAGSRIAFASGRAGKPEVFPDRPNLQTVPTDLRPSRPANDIYIVQADGTGAVRLTDDPSDNTAPAWSPDGGSIVFSSSRDDGQLCVVDTDGTGLRTLTPFDGTDTSPSWTA